MRIIASLLSRALLLVYLQYKNKYYNEKEELVNKQLQLDVNVCRYQERFPMAEHMSEPVN